ncbi:hypothetical protein PsYK624_049390 [Phanerochaete sordida]|uniref:Mannoprotein n=1 Tax=Phanerochaete sordida TaxID=48140 RepID=A0A9P3G487_9APHY|nr:hypothetical protein PsYK624_049390 [Phanerochaete sordida]
MSRAALSVLLAFVAAAVAQQDPPGSTPLAEKHFSYPDGIPYKVDTLTGIRGTQSGYNMCNSTTEGPESLCQTGFINHIDDWCVWAPPSGPTTIGDSEGDEVAWCTKPGRGTRIIPAGAITGVQFLRAKSYVEVLAFFDQTLLNMTPDDFGGELDPHGRDLRGNPMGGLIYSNGLPMSGSGDNNTFTQVIEWHNFIGANFSCFKACDPQDPDAPNYCYNRLDRVGISYVCPNQAQNNVFEVCDSDNQDFVGVYTSDGQTLTYTQPADDVPITMPYTARIPASSNCVTYQSTDLFPNLPTPTRAAASAGATPTGSGSGAGSPSRTGSAGSSPTGAKGSGSSSGGAAPTGGAATGGAAALHGSAFAAFAGLAGAVFFL